MSEKFCSLPDHRRVVHIYLLLLLAALFCREMPGLRSAYSAEEGSLNRSQRQRLIRDWWYKTAHSKPNMKFVQVEKSVAPAVRHMARAKEVHRARDDALATSSSFGRDASFAAKAAGKINAATLRDDLRCYRNANLAKHTMKYEDKLPLPKRAVPSRPPWARR